MSQTFILPKQTDRTRQIERIAATLKGLPQDRPWVLSVVEKVATRSDPQNRYLWGVVYPTILQAGGETLAGWTKEEIHEYFLGEHFGWEVLAGFGVKRRRPVRRSSKLSKLEFADYIAFIQNKMAEVWIYVPDPNE